MDEKKSDIIEQKQKIDKVKEFEEVIKSEDKIAETKTQTTTIMSGDEKTTTKVTTKKTEDGEERTTLITTTKVEPVVETVTTTQIVDGKGKIEIPEPSTTTSEKRTFSTSEDGTVTEHIVVENRTTSVIDSSELQGDKHELLQKLGEELGKLDEQLEEKFKEKRKPEEPEGKNRVNGSTLLLLSLIG